MPEKLPAEKQQMRAVIMVLAVAGLLIASVIALALFSSNTPDSTEMADGDFTLHSNKGPVSLSQFRGQAVLLFFGYTHCPDVCPTTMTNVADAMALLSKDEEARVQPLFITVDPARDTVEHLARYVGFFHPKLIGLSGSEHEIKAVAEKYSVEFFRDDQSDAGEGNYYFNHTSYLFLISQDGEVVDMMSEHTTPANIAQALRHYISK